MMKIRISGLIQESIVDGPGLRFVIFMQGCVLNCKNCHNPQTHNLTGGYEIDTDEIIQTICENPLLDGVTISGGEPFLQEKQLIPLIKKIKQHNLSTIVYTGYTFEKLKNKDLLNYIDYLIDGPYIEELKSLSLMYRGSSNQRFIDVQQSLLTNKVIEIQFNEFGEIKTT